MANGWLLDSRLSGLGSEALAGVIVLCSWARQCPSPPRSINGYWQPVRAT